MGILRRARESNGQGVVGFMSVIVLFGATVAVATPTYLGFQNRKADKQAQADLRAAVSTAETYRRTHRGSYAGMDVVDLMKIDPRVAATITVASARRSSYCLANNLRGNAWSISGPYKGELAFKPNAACA